MNDKSSDRKRKWRRGNFRGYKFFFIARTAEENKWAAPLKGVGRGPSAHCSEIASFCGAASSRRLVSHHSCRVNVSNASSVVLNFHLHGPKVRNCPLCSPFLETSPPMPLSDSEVTMVADLPFARAPYFFALREPFRRRHSTELYFAAGK
jgi:hypothetical protein